MSLFPVALARTIYCECYWGACAESFIFGEIYVSEVNATAVTEGIGVRSRTLVGPNAGVHLRSCASHSGNDTSKREESAHARHKYQDLFHPTPLYSTSPLCLFAFLPHVPCFLWRGRRMQQKMIRIKILPKIGKTLMATQQMMTARLTGLRRDS